MCDSGFLSLSKENKVVQQTGEDYLFNSCYMTPSIRSSGTHSVTVTLAQVNRYGIDMWFGVTKKPFKKRGGYWIGFYPDDWSVKLENGKTVNDGEWKDYIPEGITD